MGRRVTIGRLRRPHGVQGEMVLERFGDDPELVRQGRPITLERAGKPVELMVNACRPVPGGRWLVTLGGVDTREAAEALRGAAVTVDESELPELEDGGYYNFQVIGLQVTTPEGESLGTVVEVWETGANDVFVVRGPRGEFLVPAVAAVIQELDLKGGRVVVTPLPGLWPELEAAPGKEDSSPEES